MKKGLLSILAGALLVVGCQNYDDQFDQLESQINALASTVAGLSAVQSDLASLSAQVNSLSGAVDAAVDAALAGGLADIEAAIETLNAAAEAASSNSDIGAIAEDVTEIQDDLQDLLDASAVYTGDVTINSVATLDIFHGMGDAIAIVNGNVDIDATPDMDATKLQETIDAILTTVKDFDYSAASTVGAVTFNNLTGTATFSLKLAGPYVAQNLVSAQNIYLYDDYKSSVTVIDFRELTSVQKFYTDTNADEIKFSKATELHLNKLVYYPPLDLTIELDEGAAFPNALDDVDIDGDQKDIDLDITGPAAVTFTNILDGTMKFKDVATVTVNGYKGTFELLEGVETFNSDSVVTLDIDSASDLETLNITGALDPDTTTDESGPDVVFTDNNNIATITLAGEIGSIDLQGNGNLTDLTVTANVDGAIAVGATGTGNGNSDLTTVTLTGASATKVHVIQNFDLETVIIDNTFIAGSGTDAVLDGEIKVIDNTSLTNLNISADKVEYLEVTGNDDLTTLDFTGLAVAGATGSPEVYIYDNDIEATAEDEEDGDTDVADGKTGDLGEISSSSGIETAKTYLAAVKADADSKMSVFFDVVNFTTEGDTTSEVLFSSAISAANISTQNTKLRIAYVVPNSADTGNASVAAKRGYLLTGFDDAGDMVDVWANGVKLVERADLTSANQGVNVANLTTAAALTNADAAGVDYSATGYANAILKLEIAANGSTMENSATTVSGSTFGRHVSDVFTISIPGANDAVVSNTTESGDPTKLVTALYNKWVAKNVTASSTWSRWSISSTGDILEFTAKDKGTSQIGDELSFTASIASASLSNVGYRIGNGNNLTNDAGDNTAKGVGIVISLLADTAGTNLGEIGSPWEDNTVGINNATITATGVTVVELSTTLNRSVTASGVITATNTYPTDSRSDVITPQQTINAAASNAVDFSRIAWLD